MRLPTKKLEKEKEEITSLTEGLEKANKLAEDERIKVVASLLESQNEMKRLQQSIDSLTLNLQQFSNQIKKLTSEKDTALADRDKSLADYAALEDELCEERQRRFEQGIAQCHYFFKSHLEHKGFDIMMILVDEQLVDISPQLSTEANSAPDQVARDVIPPAPKAPPTLPPSGNTTRG